MWWIYVGTLVVPLADAVEGGYPVYDNDAAAAARLGLPDLVLRHVGGCRSTQKTSVRNPHQRLGDSVRLVLAL